MTAPDRHPTLLCDPIKSDELTEWRGAIGRTETRSQVLDVESLRRFAAAVGADLDVDQHQPPLAHWAYFLEALAAHGLGRDGHALRDRGLLPPVRLPHRMFAATRIRFAEPLALGREAELTLTLTSVEHRVTRSGDLIFVDVDRQLRQEGSLRVTERQTLVYRGTQSAMPIPVPTAAAEPGAAGAQVRTGEALWLPTRVDLFRFSAATFNAHRIHYDVPYARDEEGYPDLVVQGPLTAAKLLAFAQRREPAPAIGSLAMRASAPLFVDQAVRLAPGKEPGEVQAIRCDGIVAVTVSLNTEHLFR
jgi:3-methylfumaryl-CoA hydratase